MTTPRGRVRKVLGLGLFALVCGALFLELLSLAGGLHLGATYDFEAVVPDALQLVPNSDVRESGVTIGRVTGITTSGANAIVSVALNRSDGPIYRNATVQVRTKTLIGESYLDVDPGTRTAGAVANGGVLPITRAQDSVQLDQILSTLTPTRRVRLQRLLTGLGGGLAGGEQRLNNTIGALSSAVENAAPVADTLAQQGQQIPVLVADLGEVFAALGKQASALQDLVRSGLGAADAVGAQQRSLSAGLRALPSTLTVAQRTGAQLAAVGRQATPVLNTLTDALSQLTPAIHDFPIAAPATLGALDRLQAARPALIALLDALENVSPTLGNAVPGIDGTLRQLRPAATYLAPYATDLGTLAAGFAGVGNQRDADGEYLRNLAVIGASLLVGLTPEEQALLAALSKIGAVQFLSHKGVNAYPAPNTEGSPKPLSHAYPRLHEDPQP